ncbi:hypothetical protein JJJ17_02640 [Paracoccus caeni]|uniref:Uncharacterized protein n=1 Tax=Paracoccus caeni TaxID=657651 RepID=A0A934VZ14_9RHOB|nr:hypothetical protein [Paracoccus caeni]MBK4214818.1 hypothetical protein [Paracoccus caeni]
MIEKFQDASPSQLLEMGARRVGRLLNQRQLAQTPTGLKSRLNERPVVGHGLQDPLQEALGVRVDDKTPLDLPGHIRSHVIRQAVPV